MDRRRFLGLTSSIAAGSIAAGGIVTGGGVLGSCASVWAQVVPAPRPGARPATGPPEPPTASAPGVSARDVKIGMSAAFKGAQAGLGTELWRGAAAYYTELNARGGVNGRQLAVIPLDDDYQPDPCVRNTIQLMEQDPVFFLSNYVGTPTLTRALPIIKRYGDAILIGNFTGAQPQREQPYVDFVFNVRASYRQEMEALVERFWALGARKFGVYYQIDAYGRSGTDGVERALAQRASRIVAEATYIRGAKFEEDMGTAVSVLRQAGCDVVLCTGAYQGCGAFVRAARDVGWTVPISNVSFVGSDAMLALLLKQGNAAGRDYTRALVNSQVVPSYDDASLPGVAEYRALMDKHNPIPPEALRDKAYAPRRYSFISLEGFINAKVVVEGLRRAGANPTRASLRQALESLRNLDLGIGAPLTFGAERHQGLDSVYFTRVEGGRWVPVTDWTAAVRP
jgi:branched-chain amino acid transport system substrate-binding protein